MAAECMICFEDLVEIDRKLKLCVCSLEICRFCYDRIATESEGEEVHCPGCRRPYEMERIVKRIGKSWIALKKKLGNQAAGRQAFLIAQILSFFTIGSPIPRELFTHAQTLGIMNDGRSLVMTEGLALLQAHGVIASVVGTEDFRARHQFYNKVHKTSNVEEVFKKCCDLFCIHLKRPSATAEFKEKLMKHAPLLMDAMLSWSSDELLQDELIEFVELICNNNV